MSAQGIIRRYYLIIEKVNRGFPTTLELIEYLEGFGLPASKRTLERDRSAIRWEFDIEILFDRGRQGYYIDKSKSTDMDSFLRFLGIVNTAELLAESLRESKDALDYISLDQSTVLRGIEFLRDLLFATKNHLKISFEHVKFDSGRIKEFHIDPYLLKEYQNRWYIVGQPEGYPDLLTFGIDRITKLLIKDQKFQPNASFNPKQRFLNVIGIESNNSQTERVVLSFTPFQGKYVKSLPWHHSQNILIDSEEEFRIEMNIVLNYELEQKILMHNHNVRVIEPESLVLKIREHLVNTLNQY
jgi:predicted DNA-binding transcriptional regulator YafY